MNDTLMNFFEHLLCFNLHFSVTSAKRSIAENKVAGGVPNSQHLVGEAVDIKPYGSVLKVHYLVYSRDTDYVPGVAYRDVQKIEIQFLTNF